MKLYICPNLSKDRYVNSSRSCISSLAKNGFECYFSKEDSLTLFGDEKHTSSPRDTDVIVSVGGDGAVLNAAKTALEYNKPLLGINGGRLGYLCAYELDSSKDITPEAVNKLVPSQRSIVRFDDSEQSASALNDIVIAKGNYGSVIKIDVMCDEKPLMSFRGDGVIISTPTGSTSYNFSAGGPVLLPESRCFAVTPICPHLSDARTIVVPDSCTLEVSVSTDVNNPAYIYCDGISFGEVKSDITLKKSTHSLTLLVNDHCSFVNNEKLHNTSLL